jgi:ferritin-like metal-binding protein YciE
MAKRAKKRKSAVRRTSRPQKKLSDLFHETLKDIYFAENKIIKTLPKMAKAAQSKELAAAFNKHLRETQGQVKRLDRVFRIIGKPPRGKPCEAINGITDEGAEIMKEFRGMPALDAGLLAAAQAVEHYEFLGTGPFVPGPNSSACPTPQVCCRKRWTRRKQPTRR